MPEVELALSELSLEQRAQLLDGSGIWQTKALSEHGVEAITFSDGPHGLRKQPQAGDHLGLAASLAATCFPPAVALACSWDPALARRIGEALGDECRAAGVAVLLGPGVNMKRSPLCGRNFEYLSEDPWLAGTIAAAWVAGLQSRGVGASLKHFAANNQETDRLRVSAEVDERTLREIYLRAFEYVVKTAHPWTVMCSYNRINGSYTSESHWLLTEVLREEWGFAGLTVSDWGGVNRRDAALAAGLDLEMPSSAGHGTAQILQAVAAGELEPQHVTRSAGRVLKLVDRARRREPKLTFDADAHHALAREAAAASAVLLKNEHAILPLDSQRGGPIAVIGEFARTPRFQGAGSSQVNPTRVENALSCLQAELAGRREVMFAAGFEVENQESDAALVAEAVRAAASAEAAIVFLGLPPSFESEGFDREHLELPAPQVELLDRVAAVNPNIVVVLSNGAAVQVSSWVDHARGLLEGWLLGQAGGAALVDLLLGRISPSGRLAETIPLRLVDTPSFGNFPGEGQQVHYGERLLIGYRWYDTRELPVAYPFGHGLSYTEFAYSELELVVLEDGPSPRVQVAATVANVGQRDGTEVLQVYVTDPVATVQRPAQELRAYMRMELSPGQRRRVQVVLDDRAFAYWHNTRRDWMVEGGEFEIRVGSSSRDIRLAGSVSLEGAEVSTPLDRDSTLAEFLADPACRAWIGERLAAGPFGSGALETDLVRMLGSVPVCRLARLPGSGFTEADIDEFLTERRTRQPAPKRGEPSAGSADE